MKLPNNVLARFSFAKCLSRLLVFVVFFGVLIPLSFYRPSNISFTDYTRSRGAFWLILLPIGWAASLVLLIMLSMLLKQLLFMERVAIWVDSGNLVYLNPIFMKISIFEIADVALGSFGWLGQPGITIRLRNGAEKVIPTGSLSEAPHLVVTRIQRAIAK